MGSDTRSYLAPQFLLWAVGRGPASLCTEVPRARKAQCTLLVGMSWFLNWTLLFPNDAGIKISKRSIVNNEKLTCKTTQT